MTPLVRPEEGAVFDLSRRTKLRLLGADRMRYLNGQITNNLRKAKESVTIRATVLSAKGRVNADVFIASEGDSFVIDSDAEVREALAARLERYIIADDVQIEDVTEEFALFHVIGGSAPALQNAHRMVQAERFGCAGTDVWLAASKHDRALQELLSQWPLCDEACAETFRIERGLPRWGHELTDEIIPIEANLEAATVDYEKGCYIGQEVISRIKMSGQTNKRLCGLVPIDGALETGMRLATAELETKDVGWVTSVATSPRLAKEIALGYVKRGFYEAGRELLAHGEQLQRVRVTVTALPFVQGKD